MRKISKHAKMENYKNNFGYFPPLYYSTPYNIPTIQGWI